MSSQPAILILARLGKDSMSAIISLRCPVLLSGEFHKDESKAMHYSFTIIYNKQGT